MVHLHECFGRRNVSDGRLELVLPPGDGATFASRYSVKSYFGDFRRMILFGSAHLGIEHIGSLQKKAVSVAPDIRRVAPIPVSFKFGTQGN